MQYAIIIICAYLIGSIPFSYLVPKLFGGIDIREHGSGNAGSTNVLRTLGLKVALVAFLGDFCKGMVPTLICYRFFGETEALIAAGVAVLAHCYPIWLHFKGGKGIASSVGLIIILFPKVFPFLFVLQFSLIFATRYMSLASISSAIAFPILAYFLGYSQHAIIFAVSLACFIVFKHRSNIVRLVKGNENKLVFKK